MIDMDERDDVAATNFSVREQTRGVMDAITYRVSYQALDLPTFKASHAATTEAVNDVMYETFSLTHMSLSPLHPRVWERDEI